MIPALSCIDMSNNIPGKIFDEIHELLRRAPIDRLIKCRRLFASNSSQVAAVPDKLNNSALDDRHKGHPLVSVSRPRAQLPSPDTFFRGSRIQWTCNIFLEKYNSRTDVSCLPPTFPKAQPCSLGVCHFKLLWLSQSKCEGRSAHCSIHSNTLDDVYAAAMEQAEHFFPCQLKHHCSVFGRAVGLGSHSLSSLMVLGSQIWRTRLQGFRSRQHSVGENVTVLCFSGCRYDVTPHLSRGSTSLGEGRLPGAPTPTPTHSLYSV